MKQTWHTIFAFGITLLMAASVISCGTVGAKVTPTPTQTLTPLPSDTPTRSDTPLPTNTPLSTSTPLPTSTPTAISNLAAEVQSDGNLRAGPGQNFSILEAVPKGSQVIILERDTTGIWFHVQLKNGNTGWMNIMVINISIDPMSIQVINATPTLDIAATQAVLATLPPEMLNAEIQKELANAGLSTDTGQLGWSQGSLVEITVTAGIGMFRPFAENLDAFDFVIKTELTWDATEEVTCAVFFRSEENIKTGHQYILNFRRLADRSGWSIEERNQNGYIRTLADFNDEIAINPENGAFNKIVLITQGHQFTLYINDQKIGTFDDSTQARMDGYFAFANAMESGQGTCRFNHTWVWLLK
jgi:hypothetical protein